MFGGGACMICRHPDQNLASPIYFPYLIRQGMRQRIEIRQHADIERLEVCIKQLLQCEGQHCSFLHSMPYKMLHMSLLLKLNGVITQDAAVTLHHNGLNITMHPSADVVELSLSPSAQTKDDLQSERFSSQAILHHARKRHRS